MKQVTLWPLATGLHAIKTRVQKHTQFTHYFMVTRRQCVPY